MSQTAVSSPQPAPAIDVILALCKTLRAQIRSPIAIATLAQIAKAVEEL